MYVLEKSVNGNRFLMFYRSVDYLSEAVRREGYMECVQLADYTIKLSDDGKTCFVVKDRSGLLQLGSQHQVKKMLKIIEILMET